MMKRIAGATKSRYLLMSTVLSLILLIASLIPLPQLQRPRWEVVVLDERGRPLRGIDVLLTWQNYSIESSGHDETLRTDESGRVVFQPITLNLSMVRRIVGACKNIALYTVHAGIGIHAHVFLLPGDNRRLPLWPKPDIDWTGSPALVQSRIVVPSLYQ